jgi:AcrR family transcriptional regulator
MVLSFLGRCWEVVMPSITRRPVARDRRATVQARVLAATEELLRDGTKFTELGVQQIIEAAGVARSTFYLNFHDKTDLLIKLADPLKRTIFGHLEEWEPNAAGSGGAEGLSVVFEQMIASYRGRAALLAAITEVAAYDRAVRDFWTDAVDDVTARVTSLLRAEQRAGRTPDDLDPVIAARVLTWGGVIARHVADGDRADDSAVARELARNSWFGTFRRPDDATG